MRRFFTEDMQPYWRSRLSIDFKVDETSGNHYDQYVALHLFKTACRELPLHTEAMLMPDQVAFAKKCFLRLREKLACFDANDPFFQRWGNYFLFFMHVSGYGVEEINYAVGKQHLMAAANSGHTEAMHVLVMAATAAGNQEFATFFSIEIFHTLMHIGFDLKQTITESEGGEAERWCERAFNLEDPVAIRFVVSRFRSTGTPQFSCQSEEDCTRLLALGRKKGDDECAYDLAFKEYGLLNAKAFPQGREAPAAEKLLIFQNDILPFFPNVLALFKRAAKLGSFDAAKTLAALHHSPVPQFLPEGVPALTSSFEDIALSLEYFKVAANLNLDYTEIMASLYHDGDTEFPGEYKFRVVPNIPEAIKWYKKLIEQSLTSADHVQKRDDWFTKLMDLYLIPTETSFDVKKALAVGEHGVRLGSIHCMAKLGCLFLRNTVGIPLDEAKASDYLRNAIRWGLISLKQRNHDLVFEYFRPRFKFLLDLIQQSLSLETLTEKFDKVKSETDQFCSYDRFLENELTIDSFLISINQLFSHFHWWQPIGVDELEIKMTRTHQSPSPM
jgi:TPR repeat protein